MLFFSSVKYFAYSLLLITASCLSVQADDDTNQGAMQPIPLHLEKKPQGQFCWKAYTAFVDAGQNAFEDHGKEHNALKALLSRKGHTQCTQVLFAPIKAVRADQQAYAAEVNELSAGYLQTFIEKLKAAADQGDLDAQKQYIKAHVRKIKGFKNQNEAREAAMNWMLANNEVADRLCKSIARSAGELGIWPKNVKDFLEPVMGILLAKAYDGNDSDKINALYNLIRLTKGEKIAVQQAGAVKEFPVREAIEHALLGEIADQSDALQTEFLKGIFDHSFGKQNLYADVWGGMPKALEAFLPHLERFALAGNEQARQIVSQHALRDPRFKAIAEKLEAQADGNAVDGDGQADNSDDAAQVNGDDSTSDAQQSDSDHSYELVDAQQSDDDSDNSDAD